MNELVSEFWPLQPECGSFANQLIKKARHTTYLVQEKANTIRTLAAILGVTPSSNEQLAGKSPEELQAPIESLQQPIAQRLN